MTSASAGLEGLLALFDATAKADVRKICRTLSITSDDFVNLVLAGRMNALADYQYACHFHEYVPKDLPPTQTDLDALAAHGVGTLSGRALKASRKMNQLFIDRRLFAAHLFYHPMQAIWHLFYFDQRDTEVRGNHWKEGPHIHYSRESYSNESLRTVWDGVRQDQPSLPKTEHIRYRDLSYGRRSLR